LGSSWRVRPPEQCSTKGNGEETKRGAELEIAHLGSTFDPMDQTQNIRECWKYEEGHILNLFDKTQPTNERKEAFLVGTSYWPTSSFIWLKPCSVI